MMQARFNYQLKALKEKVQKNRLCAISGWNFSSQCTPVIFDLVGSKQGGFHFR